MHCFNTSWVVVNETRTSLGRCVPSTLVHFKDYCPSLDFKSRLFVFMNGFNPNFCFCHLPFWVFRPAKEGMWRNKENVFTNMSNITIFWLLDKSDSLLLKQFAGCIDVRNGNPNVSCEPNREQWVHAAAAHTRCSCEPSNRNSTQLDRSKWNKWLVN